MPQPLKAIPQPQRGLDSNFTDNLKQSKLPTKRTLIELWSMTKIDNSGTFYIHNH
jgi:hypothetical protein